MKKITSHPTARLAIVATLLLVEAVAVRSLYADLGFGVLASSLAPLSVAAWLFGRRAGIAASVAIGLVFNPLLAMPFVAPGPSQLLLHAIPSVMLLLVAGLVGSLRDLSARLADRTARLKEQSDLLMQRALHDELTTLPNRALLHDRLGQGLAGARRDDGTCALLLVDLDNFKDVNDGYGHAAGDQLLIQAATRLRRAVRETDTVARLGGDEFAVALPGADEAGARRVADAILHALAEPFVVAGGRAYVGASVGIAVAPRDGVDEGELLRAADVAMYAAKRAGSPPTAYPEVGNDGRPRHETLALAADLRQAIARRELTLMYQPIVDRRSATVRAMEALARWTRPDGRVISPDEFIPVAEHSGLVRDLTEWALQEALEQCVSWHRSGTSLRVSVNVSPRSLHDPAFADFVRQALQEAHAEPAWLTLEVTETGVVADDPRILRTIERLRAMGVRVAIDDFGTGYTSLAYLGRVPADVLKIDSSFISRMRTEKVAAAVVQATVAFAHAAGMRTAAEGVEDAATWAQLAAMDCDSIQGYLISKPLASGDVQRWLHESPWGTTSTVVAPPTPIVPRWDLANARVRAWQTALPQVS